MKNAAKPAKKNTKKAKKPAQILESILAHVPFDGWTDLAFEAGAAESGMTEAESTKLFPRGIADAVTLFSDSVDEAMQQSIAATRGFSRMRVREKVGFAVRARFEYLMPHREAVRRLIMWYALPMHAAQGIKRVAKTADIIWQAAGDTSTDYNFYTKRFLLAAVMKATMLYWLNDQTAGCTGTWEFLDRRLSEVVKAGKAISLAREYTPSEMFEMVKSKLKRAV